MINLCILGSTGSIGTQTLDIVRDNKSKFNVVALSGNNNIELLHKQIHEFKPRYVAVNNLEKAKLLKSKTNNLDVAILSGIEGLKDIASLEEVDTVVTAVVGNIGILPTIEAIKTHKNIALANKETLVAAGEIIMNLAKDYGVSIIPIDSEHSAILQCLEGHNKKDLEKIILTASGGPFRGMNSDELVNVKYIDALKHPNWNMGSKISIDSATLMNKGLEVIEAKWLFNLEIEEINVIVHPQSIIHSMVEYIDGTVIAQLGSPDMRIPIQYALSHPHRIKLNSNKISFDKLSSLTFEQPDIETFPCLGLAFEALKTGGTMPAVLNSANEELVSKYLKDEIKFYDIPKGIEMAMKKHKIIKDPSIDDILTIDKDIRQYINYNF